MCVSENEEERGWLREQGRECERECARGPVVSSKLAVKRPAAASPSSPLSSSLLLLLLPPPPPPPLAHSLCPFVPCAPLRPDNKNALYQDTIKKGDVLLNRIQKLSKVIDVE